MKKMKKILIIITSLNSLRDQTNQFLLLIEIHISSFCVTQDYIKSFSLFAFFFVHAQVKIQLSLIEFLAFY